jgi:hypothetical protein
MSTDAGCVSLRTGAYGIFDLGGEGVAAVGEGIAGTDGSIGGAGGGDGEGVDSEGRGTVGEFWSSCVWFTNSLAECIECSCLATESRGARRGSASDNLSSTGSEGSRRWNRVDGRAEGGV